MQFGGPKYHGIRPPRSITWKPRRQWGQSIKMPRIGEPKVQWGHMGKAGKWHVDLTYSKGRESHRHSPTIFSPPRDRYGAIRVNKGQLPLPYGPWPKGLRPSGPKRRRFI